MRNKTLSDILFYLFLSILIALVVFMNFGYKRVVTVVHKQEKIDSVHVFNEYLSNHRPEAARRHIPDSYIKDIK